MEKTESKTHNYIIKYCNTLRYCIDIIASVKYRNTEQNRFFSPTTITDVRLTMYTHFTFTLMAHCTSRAIRGSVSCSRTLRQGIELATFCLLNDLFTSCTTVAPIHG